MSLINNKYFWAIAQLPWYIRCRWIQWLDVYRVSSISPIAKRTNERAEMKKKKFEWGTGDANLFCGVDLFGKWSWNCTMSFVIIVVVVVQSMFIVYCFPDDRSIHCDCVHRKQIYFSRVFISMHDKFTYFFFSLSLRFTNFCLISSEMLLRSTKISA